MTTNNTHNTQPFDRLEEEIVREIMVDIGLDTRKKLSDFIESNIDKVEVLQDLGIYDPNIREHHDLAGNIRNYCSYYKTIYGVSYMEDRAKLVKTETYVRC